MCKCLTLTTGVRVDACVCGGVSRTTTTTTTTTTIIIIYLFIVIIIISIIRVDVCVYEDVPKEPLKKKQGLKTFQKNLANLRPIIDRFITNYSVDLYSCVLDESRREVSPVPLCVCVPVPLSLSV